MVKVFIYVFLIMAISLVNAQEKKPFTANEPVLITSVGQSADILMVKILAKKAGLDFTFDKTASPEKVDKVKSVIIVCGGSTKGLGAAKIDKEDEYARAKELIDRAKKNKISVIALHVGGKARRGKLSDYFNTLGAENADHIIAVKSGDQDGFFTKIAKEKSIRLDLSEKIVAITDLLKRIYSK